MSSYRGRPGSLPVLIARGARSRVHFGYIPGVGVLNLHEFTFMFTISSMARRTRLIILRLNILCRQRQVIHVLSEVHISIIIQVTRDIFNIEAIIQ